MREIEGETGEEELMMGEKMERAEQRRGVGEGGWEGQDANRDGQTVRKRRRSEEGDTKRETLLKGNSTTF